MKSQTILMIALLAVTASQAAQEPQAHQNQESAQAADLQSEQMAGNQLVPHNGWKEGVNYERITPLPAAELGQFGKNYALEFFQYSCHHCMNLEPPMQYREHLGMHSTALIRVPMVSGERSRSYARLFYTLIKLKRMDLHWRFYEAVNSAIRKNQNDLTTFEDQRDFAAANDVNVAQFDSIYKSDGITTRAAEAERLSKAYKIDATPMLIVQNKYRTSSGRAGGPARVPVLLDWLAAQQP